MRDVRDLTYGDVPVGSVLMVTTEYRPKGSEKIVPWKWFGVVTKTNDKLKHVRAVSLRVYRLGAREGMGERGLYIHDDDVISAYLLEPDEWPDGVHALRARLVLDGTIDLGF